MLRLRDATEADVGPVLALINGYAERNLLLSRSEESLRERLADFVVAEAGGEVVGCGALSELGPGLGEVRSLAVRADQSGRGLGHALVEHLIGKARERDFAWVLALTRRVSFFEALGFEVTRRELFLDKLEADCRHCPLNQNCDETALVRSPWATESEATATRQSSEPASYEPNVAWGVWGRPFEALRAAEGSATDRPGSVQASRRPR